MHRRANSEEHLEHLTEPEGRTQLWGGGGCTGEEEQLAATRRQDSLIDDRNGSAPPR